MVYIKIQFIIYYFKTYINKVYILVSSLKINCKSGLSSVMTILTALSKFNTSVNKLSEVYNINNQSNESN